MTTVTWPRRPYVTICHRHPDCEADPVMAARCAGYADHVIGSTAAPEWAAESVAAPGTSDWPPGVRAEIEQQGEEWRRYSEAWASIGGVTIDGLDVSWSPVSPRRSA